MQVDLGQVFAGGVDQFGIEVDRADSMIAEPVGEEGGVVAGAGADLEHPVPRPCREPLEHPRHNRRLARGRGGNRTPGGVRGAGLRGQRLVGVDHVQPALVAVPEHRAGVEDLWDELVSRRRGKRLPPCWVEDDTGGAQLGVEFGGERGRPGLPGCGV